MIDGNLYSVWVDDDMSPAFTVYHDDAEAIASFCRLIHSIRKDIQSGTIAEGTDKSLHLCIHGSIKDGKIFGLEHPYCLMHGVKVPDEFDVEHADIIAPEDECEVCE